MLMLILMLVVVLVLVVCEEVDDVELERQVLR